MACPVTLEEVCKKQFSTIIFWAYCVKIHRSSTTINIENENVFTVHSKGILIKLFRFKRNM
jgi:hypothetical protein